MNLNFAIYWLIGYHGKLGPLAVSVVKTTPLAEYLVESARELGYEILDYNAENQEGERGESQFHDII